MTPAARAPIWLQSLRLLALLALSSAAQAELVEIAWNAAGRFERQLHLAPGRFVELCGKLPTKTQVRWQFDAGTATDFNIHFHEGKAVHYPAKEDGVTSATGTLEAAREEDYCWMWSNKSTRSTPLNVSLEKLR